MKVKEITVQKLADYLRISETTDSFKDSLNDYLNIAKEYIYNYTGLEREKIEDSVALCIVIFVLVQDMYDNRSLYVDDKNINKVVSSILEQHRRNFL